MAIFIPWDWFEPLPEWARVPLVVGVVATFIWVVLWAMRQRRSDDGSQADTPWTPGTLRVIAMAIIVMIVTALILAIISASP